jgi:hypothetical protein
MLIRSTAIDAFLPIFFFRVLDRLPLHICRRVWTAAGKRDDMVNDVAWTRAGAKARCGTWMLVLEFTLR